MTSQEQEIQELRDLVSTLRAENLALQQNNRAEQQQRDNNDAAGETTRLGQVRYRTIFENSLLGNKIISSDLKILQVNQALVDLLGYTSKQDLIGHHILEFAHPNFTKDWRILQQKLWDKHTPSFSLETCLLHQDGRGIWVNVTSILFRDGDETLGYTIIENISERRRSMDSLMIRERHFRTITDIMPQQVWTAAPDGKLNFVNQQVCDYFGRDADDLTGNGWQEFIHPDDMPACLKAWLRSLETGEDYVIEFRLRGADSDYKWYLGRALPIRDEEGTISLWLGTNTDIDSQKTNERRKDEFMSIASHELKTPLTSIKLYNQLANQTTDPAKQKDFIQKSTANISRLERLIADLLDVARINAGKIAYNREEFDFALLMQETISSFQLLTPTHQLVFSPPESLMVTADRHRLEQVLNNLLSNAVKYSPQADRVLISAKVLADSVVVSVQDFGIGIPPDDLTKLFDRYYRADNAAMRFEGLGLGLFISAEILKRHNGSLWIESEPGKGSTFNFILPLNGEHLLTELDSDYETYYFANYITIQYNPLTAYLEADWLGYQNLESVQKGCMILLDLLKKNNCHKVLNDNTQVMGNWSEASDWGAEYWFPAMAEAGLKQFAWIDSPSAFSRLAASKSLGTEPAAFETRFFTDKALGAEWLNGNQALNPAT